MANVRSMYGGSYMQAADVPVDNTRLNIAAVAIDPKLDKVSLEFQGEEKELLLNKTNALFLANALGDESDTWPGCWLELRRENVMYMGKSVAGIRVTAAGRNGHEGKSRIGGR
jgi:hypothetical protein